MFDTILLAKGLTEKIIYIYIYIYIYSIDICQHCWELNFQLVKIYLLPCPLDHYYKHQITVKEEVRKVYYVIFHHLNIDSNPLGLPWKCLVSPNSVFPYMPCCESYVALLNQLYLVIPFLFIYLFLNSWSWNFTIWWK